MRTLCPLNVAFILATGATLGGCSSYYGGFGGYGGHSGVSIGIGTGGGYYDPYYGGGYYGSPYWGWYDGFYYPGTGYYVYDADRRPHRWSDSQQRYWTQRRAVTGTTSAMTTTSVRPNWSGFNRSKTTTSSTTSVTRPERQQRAQSSRVERRQADQSDPATATEKPQPKR
jgi:hypothetical protein